MVYFTSDFHLSQEQIILFERNQFDKIADHDKTIMDSLSILRENDEIWFLGDMGNPNDFISEKIRTMKCAKYMIKGNHDHESNNYYVNKFGLKECYDKPIWLNEKILLSHYPLPVEDATLNIHGHLHGSVIDKPNYLNANIYLWDFKLISMDEVQEIIKTLPSFKRKYMEEWYKDIQKALKSDFRIDRILYEDGTIAGVKPYRYRDNRIVITSNPKKDKDTIEINSHLVGKSLLLDNKKYKIIDVNGKGIVTNKGFVSYAEDFIILKPIINS